MKIGHLLLLCWLFISQRYGKLLKSSPHDHKSKHRELEWITDTLTKKNVALGMMAGVPALATTMLFTMPDKTTTSNKKRAGRRLKFEQTIYETRQSTNKQMMTEVEEMIHRGDAMLREFQKDALNRINGLRSDIHLKFRDYGIENDKRDN